MIDRPDEPGGNQAPPVVAVLLIATVFYLVTSGNYFHFHTITSEILTKIYVDAGELIPQDFIDAYFRGLRFPSFYAIVPSWIYRTLHPDIRVLLETMGWLLIVLAGMGMLSMARSLCPPSRVLSILAAAFYLFSDIGYVSPSFWAAPAQLAASYYGVAMTCAVLAAFLARRFYLSALLLGVTTCIHPAHAILSAGPLLTAYLWTERSEPGRQRRLVLSLACFGIGVLPYLVFVLPRVTYFNWEGLTGDHLVKLYEVLRLKWHYHLFPSEWHPVRHVTFGLFLGLSVIGIRFLTPVARRMFVPLLSLYLVFSVLCWIFTEWVPAYSVIKLSPLRILTHVTLLCVIPFFTALYRVWVDEESPWPKVAAMWLMVSMFFSTEGIAFIPGILLFLDQSILRSRFSASSLVQLRPILYGSSMALPMAVYIIPHSMTGGVSIHRIIQYVYAGSWAHLSYWKIGVLAAGVGAAWLVARRRPTAATASVTAAILVGLFCAAKGVDLWQIRMRNNPQFMAYYDAQVWAHASTPPEAMFAVDPQLGGFRDFARRESFLTWVDIIFPWQNPIFYDSVVGRFNALGFTLEELKQVAPSRRPLHLSEKFSMLDAAVFRSIRAAHPRLEYVLYQNERHPKIQFPIVYQNAYFTVCRIVSQ